MYRFYIFQQYMFFFSLFAPDPVCADPIDKFREKFIQQDRHIIETANEQRAARLLDQRNDMTRQSLAADATDRHRLIFNPAWANNMLIELRA